jgi:hypothetical protein
LTRIADAVRGKPVAPRASRAAEAATAAVPAAAARAEPPLKQPVEASPPEIQVRPPVRPEPRVEPRPAPAIAAMPPPAAANGAANPTANAVDVSASAIERLRSSLPRPDAVVPEAESGPLSPNGAGHPPLPPMPPPEPKAKPAEAAARAGNAAVETAPEPRGSRLDFLFRSRNARPAQPENFDALWPKRPGGGQKQAEPAKAAVAEGAQADDEASLSAETKVAAPAAPPAAEEARPAAILKSGVVDGMAYTLYADGSIEAQLPQGTVRFGSIAELRAHIENNS